MKPITCALFLSCATLLAAESAAPKFDSMRLLPKTPAESQNTFQCLDGFQMKLLAAEPLITDPVAMVYDENGVAYVAEMNDYPFTDKKNDVAWKESADPPGGRIRVLVDEDGDGKFDKSFIFAENLSWPTGIACWKGGIFVIATPDLWYLQDTNGDHVADVRIKVCSGFRKYNVQAVANNLIWGLDNRIYGAGSGNGGTISVTSHPNEKPITLSRNDFRLDPTNDRFEALSGGARFGNSFDDWGNRFICNIRNPVQNVVLPAHYLARNPYLLVHSAITDCARASDDLPVYRVSAPEPWRVVRAQQWSSDGHKYPRSETRAEGFFTSTSGITIYRGAAYPAKYYGNAFLGEVAGNLVHRQILTTNGVTFFAERGDKETEFVRSTDNWFRPVNYVNAPDGTLHVLDMYRETIEHPWSIPDDIKAQLDLLSGKDRGRIYRLEPPNFKPIKPPRLGQASISDLVATLENPNSWWRETAHRLIYERQDKAAIKPLRKLLQKSQSPLARLHALYSLDGLNVLTDADILLGLTDSHPGVREHSVRLAESRLNQSPKLLDKVLTLSDDPAMRVRFQTAFTLGESHDPRVTAALLKIAQQDPNDPWMQTAVLSSMNGRAVEALSTLLRDLQKSQSDAGAPFVKQLSFMIGARGNTNEIAEAMRSFPSGQNVGLQINLLVGMADGTKRAGKNLSQLLQGRGAFAQVFSSLMMTAQMSALKPDASTEQRQDWIRILGYGNFDDSRKTLLELLDAKQPHEIQMAAVRTLSSFVHPQVAGLLIERWAGFTPTLRSEAVEALVARKERLQPLLDAVESGTISSREIPATRQTMLMTHKDKSISARATKLLGQNRPSPRKEVIEKYQAALSLKGDKARGEKVFEANCVPCHRVGTKGNEVGPNLATVRAWSPDQIMVNVLDPNREVSPQYVNYEVELKNGDSLGGVIAEETPTSVTLKRANAVQDTILRSNIARITSSKMSLMPEGLEAGIPPQAMADLIAFLLSP